MWKKLVIYSLILSLVLPQQLMLVFANDSLSNALGDELISSQAIARELQDLKSTDLGQKEKPKPIEPTPEPVKPDPIKPEPIKPEPIKPEPIKPPDPIVPKPVGPSTEYQKYYACLLNDMQTVMGYSNFANNPMEGFVYSAEAMGNNLEASRPALFFDVEFKDKYTINPLRTCRAKIKTMTESNFEHLVTELLSFYSEGVIQTAILQDFLKEQDSIGAGKGTERFEIKNSLKKFIFRPSHEIAEANAKLVSTKGLRFFADMANLEGGKIKDPNFSAMNTRSADRGAYYLLGLRIKLEYAYHNKEGMEAEAVVQNTNKITDSVDKAREEAKKQEDSANSKEMWGNIAKVGLAIGGGILAWKLIDSLNKSDDKDNDDDRFDGPMYPPYMMNPYGYNNMMSGGMMPGMYPQMPYPSMNQMPYQPYPPQQMYPPQVQQPIQYPTTQTPVQTVPSVNQGADYGRLLVDLKAKLEAIIRLQSQIIEQYVRRTNSNMTDSDKDNFRRVVAQIDGLVTEANPLIQMMENSAVPGGQDMSYINSARQKCYEMIQEIKNNDRIIKEFNQKMNIVGTGMAGPMSPTSSGVGSTATPWTDPRARQIIDTYLTSNKLNQWGYPDSPGVTQHTPPSAVGKDRYQWLLENPRIAAHVNTELAKKS